MIFSVVMARERHQNGWVEEVGKRVKKWKGHWNPYREDGTRGHSSRILGEKSKMRKWEAEEALRKIINEAEGQQAKCPDGVPTFGWYWENAYLPSRTWGPAYKSAVNSIFNVHVLPVFGRKQIPQLDKLELQQHVNKLAAGYSGSLVKKVIVQFKSMLEEAVEQDIITKNPARKLQKPQTKKPCGRFLSLEEYDALVAQLEFRDRLIVRMFCLMGFRSGELFAIRWNDVEKDRIRVDESSSRWGIKDPKTAGSDAFVPMPGSIRTDMEMWRGIHRIVSPESLVFPTATGTPISGHNYERDVIVPAAIRAGIMAKPAKYRMKYAPIRSKDTAVNFQAFRRTFGTWMQRVPSASIKDVQRAMRHASPDQTINVYMREIPGSVRTAVEELDRIFSEDRKAEGKVQ